MPAYVPSFVWGSSRLLRRAPDRRGDRNRRARRWSAARSSFGSSSIRWIRQAFDDTKEDRGFYGGAAAPRTAAARKPRARRSPRRQDSMNGRLRAASPDRLRRPARPGVRRSSSRRSASTSSSCVADFSRRFASDRLFGLVPYDVTHHLFLWQMVSLSCFSTAASSTSCCNMLALWMFGTRAGVALGNPEVLPLLFRDGHRSGALLDARDAEQHDPDHRRVRERSTALLAAYGLLFPERILLLYLVILIKAKYFVLIPRGASLSGRATSRRPAAGSAHVAHLGRMLFGWLYLRGASDRGAESNSDPFRGLRDRWRARRLRRKFKGLLQGNAGR